MSFDYICDGVRSYLNWDTIPSRLTERVAVPSYAIDLPYLPGDEVYAVVLAVAITCVLKLTVRDILLDKDESITYVLRDWKGYLFIVPPWVLYKTQDEADKALAAEIERMEELNEMWNEIKHD